MDREIKIKIIKAIQEHFAIQDDEDIQTYGYCIAKTDFVNILCYAIYHKPYALSKYFKKYHGSLYVKYVTDDEDKFIQECVEVMYAKNAISVTKSNRAFRISKEIINCDVSKYINKEKKYECV